MSYVVRDGNGTALTKSASDVGSGVQADNCRICDATAANFMPTMDAVGRPGFQKITDGTNTMPTMDVVGRPGFQKITDGTNTMPTMDVAARPGFQKITDGTNTMPTMDAIARAGFVQASDGTNAFKSGNAANISALASINSMLVAKPGEWSATHAPVVNTAATATKAAGAAGVRHVCTGVSFCVASDAAATPTALLVHLRDGATGVGAILASWYISISATAGESRQVAITGLNIVGAAATAMCLEFAAAPGANAYASVAIQGYDAAA